MSELSKRVIFSVIAAPTAILIVYLGGPALVALVGVISGIATWEFYRLSRATGAEPFEGLGITLAALLPIALYARELGLTRLPVTAAAVIAVSTLAAAIWLRPPGRKPILAVAITVFGVIYAGQLSYLYGIRYHPYVIDAAAGAALVTLPLLITWATDVGAYFVGRAMGRSLLAPSISPKKTWAGAVGGLVLAVFVAVFYVSWVLRPVASLSMTLSATVAFGALASIAAQVGDIAESLLKREAGVKDSSSIIPGHGGVLDRFDSMLFVLPVSYLLLGWWLIPAP
ncbi:MAG TPA: phosphatidate cytidylyltransferase [Gemmatimonadaceae bacterium]|nr:phosphatidate cytidylyltransferase [Gemmatimonadaceae bacterium]